MSRITVQASQDYDAECPLDMMSDLVEFHSFSPRHSRYKDPDSFGLYRDKDGRFTSSDIGVRTKLKAGTAVLLSYFSHGNCDWSIAPEKPTFTFDSVGVAGILLMQRSLHTSKEDRLRFAGSVLDEYTAWSNGEVYHIKFPENSDFEKFDCGGIYDVKEYLNEVLAEGQEVVIQYVDDHCRSMWEETHTAVKERPVDAS